MSLTYKTRNELMFELSLPPFKLDVFYQPNAATYIILEFKGFM